MAENRATQSTWQQVMENTFARYREEGGIVDDGWCRFELETAVNRKMMTMGEITSDKIPELIAFMVAFLNQRVRRVVVRTAGNADPHHTDSMVGADVPGRPHSVRVAICHYIADGERAEFREVDYAGPIPPEAIEMFNRAFKTALKNGRFYPHRDPMEAYQDGFMALTLRAERMPALKSASSRTYFTRTINGIFRAWVARKVAPLREAYREVQRLYSGRRGAVGVDGFDVDDWDPTDLGCSVEMGRTGDIDSADDAGDAFEEEHDGGVERRFPVTLFSFGESLMRTCTARSREEFAQRDLNSVRRIIRTRAGDDADEILAAFDAYVESDGNLFAVARALGVCKSTFYVRWEKLLSRVKGMLEAVNRQS